MKKVLLTAALTMALPMAAFAWQPTADVKVIVAYKAGSGTDTGARLLMSQAEKFVGKTLVINNLPGADGKIGWKELVTAKPDGHTIGFINLPTFTTLAAQWLSGTSVKPAGSGLMAFTFSAPTIMAQMILAA